MGNPYSDGFASRFSELELHWPLRLPLHDDRSRGESGSLIDVAYPQRDQIKSSSLLSMARLNKARSRALPASCRRMRGVQISFGFSGGTCACGQLSLQVRGDPSMHGVCHCTAAWFFVGLAGAAFMQLLQSTPDLPFSLGLVAVLLSLGVLALVLAPWLSGRIVQRHLLLIGGTLLSAQTAVVSYEGINLAAGNGGSSSHFKWRAFIGRAEDEQNCYLFIETSYGLIVPKAALSLKEVALVRSGVNEL